MSFKKEETTTEVYTYTSDDALGPGEATQSAKSKFAEEHDVPFGEVIGKKIRDAEHKHVGDGEFEWQSGPVIVVLHDPRI